MATSRLTVGSASAAVLSCLLIGAAAFAPAPPARGQVDPFAELTHADTPEARLGAAVARAAGPLARGGHKARLKPIVYVAPGTDATREKRLLEIIDQYKSGKTALEQAGFDMSGREPELTIVEVTARGGFVGAVMAPRGGIILIRNGKRAAAKLPRRGLPTLHERDDGPSTERDVIDCAALLRERLWASATGVATDGASLEELFAAHLIDWKLPRATTAPWLRVAMTTWVGAAITGEPLEASGHRCGGTAAPDIAALMKDHESAQRAAVLLGRVVAKLVADGKDIAEAAPGLMAGDPSTTFEAAFGMKTAAVGDAVAPPPTTDAACEQGTVPCPVCLGDGKAAIACPDCLGLDKVACPSCRGSQSCTSPYCTGGKVIFESGRMSKCKVCGGKATLKCKACSGKGSRKCGACKRGEVERPCPACETGRVPCPEAGFSEAIAKLAGEGGERKCLYCANTDGKRGCSDCGGAGYLGCGKCDGRQRRPCSNCLATGSVRMVFTDGTTASNSKCSHCGGKGFGRCGDCSKGRNNCGACKGKGVESLTDDDCRQCDGSHVLPTVVDTIAKRREMLSPPNQEDAKQIHAVMDRATKFLLTCNRTRTGAFALREFRASKNSSVGKLWEPTLFSNANVLFTLSTAGIERDDPRVAKAWDQLTQQAQKLADGTDYQGTQAASQSLRALIGGGAKPDSDLVKGLVKKLEKGQQSNGFWGPRLDEKEEGDAFTALFAIESLWLAQRRGVKVSGSTFGKAFRAANAQFSSKGYKPMKTDYVTASDVASATAMVVIAKAGSLGKKAGTFDYWSLDGVKRGVAWLDRYFDVRDQPAFYKGAYVPGTGDAGYAAYLFAIQRLAMLLDIPVLNGERWYVTGARHLATLQNSDGSFEETGYYKLNGPVRTTSSVLLFLARATPAVTDE